MSILVNENTCLLVQGITGREGSFHAERCMAYGTNLVAGVTPGKGGERFMDKVPVFDSVQQAVAETSANVALIFVPPPFAADAILESTDAGIPLVVCITEGVPVRDSTMVMRYLEGKQTRLLGPNCPGLITPGANAKVGIMPGNIHMAGKVGVVSRSGTPHLRGRRPADETRHRAIHLRRHRRRPRLRHDVRGRTRHVQRRP